MLIFEECWNKLCLTHCERKNRVNRAHEMRFVGFTGRMTRACSLVWKSTVGSDYRGSLLCGQHLHSEPGGCSSKLDLIVSLSFPAFPLLWTADATRQTRWKPVICSIQSKMLHSHIEQFKSCEAICTPTHASSLKYERTAFALSFEHSTTVSCWRTSTTYQRAGLLSCVPITAIA